MNESTILIVDDAEDSLKLSVKLLGPEFRCLEAQNGKEALEILRRERVDLVLSDVLMPEMDGFTLCSEVQKAFEAGKRPRFIFYSATHDEPAHHEVAERLGADGFLSRPIPRERLIAEIRRALAGPKPKAAAEAEAPELSPLREYSEWLVQRLEGRAVELKESEERFRSLSEASSEAIAIIEEGKILDVNSNFSRLFAINIAEAVDRPVTDFIADESRELVLRRMSSDEEEPYEVVARRKDGAVFPVEIRGKSMPYQGRVVRVQAIRDLTERKRLEAQFLQAQRMEAMGRLAGGVAHDFNNILLVIMAHCSFLLDGMEAKDPKRADVEEIKTAGERAAGLTRQLLIFSRKQLVQFRPLSINSVVENMGKMIRRILGEDIEVLTKLDPSLKWVKADHGQIEQIIMNLVVNARDAMPQGGKLAVETANVELDGRHSNKHFSVKPGPHALLSVRDSGGGMDAATLGRLFEPFFTTKEVGKGTGLGLSTIYGIVKQGGGSISVESEVGRGTTFNIYLPATAEGAPQDQSEPAPVQLLRGSETILLVEDDEPIRNLGRRVLAAQGYAVLEAANGEEALKLCQSHPRDIHLLLTDAVMPKLNAADLIQRAAALRPRLRVLLMSGYTDNPTIRQLTEEEGVHFLQKPFSPDALARKVREVLASEGLAAP